LASGSRPLRRPGRRRRVRRPVRAVQDERPSLVPGGRLRACPRHRLAAAWTALSMALAELASRHGLGSAISGPTSWIPSSSGEELGMKRLLFLGVSAMAALASAPAVLAFCGFYVAKADTKLFNQASQVVLVRNDDKTVLTMASDFKGDPKEFAIVVPVPTVLEKGQIRVSDRALVAHLDAYTAPRLVEYFDDDPCSPRYPAALQAPMGMATARRAMAVDRANSLGVTIEARYTV